MMSGKMGGNTKEVSGRNNSLNGSISSETLQEAKSEDRISKNTETESIARIIISQIKYIILFAVYNPDTNWRKDWQDLWETLTVGLT